MNNPCRERKKKRAWFKRSLNEEGLVATAITTRKS